MTIHRTQANVAEEMEGVFASFRGRTRASAQPSQLRASAQPSGSEPRQAKRRFWPLLWLASAVMFGLSIAAGSIIAGTIDDIASFKSSAPSGASSDKFRSSSPRPTKFLEQPSGDDDAKIDEPFKNAPILNALNLNANRRSGLGPSEPGTVADTSSRQAAQLPVVSAPSNVASAQILQINRAGGHPGLQSQASERGAEPTSSFCDPSGREGQCDFQDVLRADAELRRAYKRATRDGVSARWLEGLIRQWDRARDDADIDPDGAVWRYRQLANAIDRKRFEEAR